MSRRAEIIEAEVDKRLQSALELVGADLAGAGARDAPIQEGTLRGSATWSVVKTARGFAVRVVFPMVYAAVQHERRDFEHPRGGKAGYLGDNLKARTPRYLSMLRRLARSL